MPITLEEWNIFIKPNLIEGCTFVYSTSVSSSKATIVKSTLFEMLMAVFENPKYQSPWNVSAFGSVSLPYLSDFKYPDGTDMVRILTKEERILNKIQKLDVQFMTASHKYKCKSKPLPLGD